MRITIVGTGYVGLVTGTCFANSGNHVTCLDISDNRISILNNGGCPIYEPGLKEMIQRNNDSGRLIFTTNKQEAYTGAEIVFLCVGTPSAEDGQADLTYILQAAEDFGAALQSDDNADEIQPVVVVKSTVPVGTNDKVRNAILSKTSKGFYMASNPEFLKEGAAIDDFCKPDRVVIGVDATESAERLQSLYQPFVRQGNPIFTMDIPSAEMVKYASNAMLATKISFINEMASLCEAFGADIDEVRKGMCSDRRIGNQFLYPGLGYGGSCFPKDVQACIHMGTLTDRPTDVLAAVHAVNQQQRRSFIEKIINHYSGDLSGKHFAVWGLSFKPGTDDMREAPSLTIINALLEHGATVTAFDPVARETAELELQNRINYATKDLDALNNADALIICTDCNQFKQPDFREMKSRLNQPVIFDGRNLYQPKQIRKAGFTYYSVGREAVIL